MSQVTIKPHEVNFNHLLNDTVKDYFAEKGIHHVVNSVGNLVLNVSKSELNIIFGALDAIGYRTSCTFDNELYLIKNNIFTSENVNIVHTYCSQKGLVNAIPFNNFTGITAKNYLLESMKPEFNFKSVDNTIIDKIDTLYL